MSKVENGEPAITSTDQLSSPWTESSEGSIEALIDGDPSSFWHSAWSGGNVPNHTHYLQVALPDGNYTGLYISMTRRNATNDHITQFGVFGSNEDSDDAVWVELASLSMPFGSKSETVE